MEIYTEHAVNKMRLYHVRVLAYPYGVVKPLLVPMQGEK